MITFPQFAMDDVFAAALGILFGTCIALVVEQIHRAFRRAKEGLTHEHRQAEASGPCAAARAGESGIPGIDGWSPAAVGEQRPCTRKPPTVMRFLDPIIGTSIERTG